MSTPKIVKYKGKYGVEDLGKITVPAVYESPVEAADEWAMYQRLEGTNQKLIIKVCVKMLKGFK